MYIVEVKDELRTCEKEFTRKANAVKAALKAKDDGYIYFDNPYLFRWQRKVQAKHVRVYDPDNPQLAIEI